MKSKSLYLVETGKVELLERDIQLAPNEVLVKAAYSSICGTDRNHFMGHMQRGSRTKDWGRASMSNFGHHKDLPLLMGHEGSGIVVDVGSAVTACKKGDLIASFAEGGTMGEYFTCPGVEEGYGLVVAPEGMSAHLASQGEPAACAIYAGLQSGVELGDRVAVVGAGFAGQIIAQVVKKMGAEKVIVSDLIDSKLDLAKKLGCDVTINPTKEDYVQRVLDETDGEGVDVVLEVAGTSESLQMCTDVLKHGGILGIYSWIMDKVNVFIDRWHDDGFDLRSLALMHRIHHDRIWYIRQAMKLMNKGIIQVEPIISHSFPLTEAQKAFEKSRDDDTVCKVELIP